MRPNNDEFIRLVQEAIAQGMVPPGNPVSPAGGQKSALRHACDVMGIHRDTGRKIWDKVNAPKPRIRVQATTETDAHFVCYGHRYMLTPWGQPRGEGRRWDHWCTRADHARGDQDPSV
jgi:hypothetical protein